MRRASLPVIIPQGLGKESEESVKFALLKLVEQLLMPVSLALLGLGVALVCGRRRPRLLRRLAVAVFAGLYLLSISPMAYLLVQSLTGLIPPVGRIDPARVEAIVILAAGARRRGALADYDELSGPGWARFWRGLKLYRSWDGAVPVIYSGGSGRVFMPESFEASLARSYALDMGHPAEDFLVEDRSRNTSENARWTGNLLDKLHPGRRHRVALVTSAIHMPRALLAFKRAGMEAVPFPAEVPFGDYHFSFNTFIPNASSLNQSTRCLHEWLGLLAARLGWGG